MIIAHEAPLKLIPHVRKITDYDYILAHHCLGEYGEEYKRIMKEEPGRLKILDNSAFELGGPIDPEAYLKLIGELKPVFVVLPDVPGDFEETLKRSIEFSNVLGEKYPAVDIIGVAQGNTLEEMVQCALALSQARLWVRIAVPYISKAYEILHPKYPQDIARVAGRIDVVTAIVKALAWKLHDRLSLHLLGCSLPLELVLYEPAVSRYIYSMDTSAPVAAALEDVYWKESYATLYKPSLKLDDHFNDDVDFGTIRQVTHNIQAFRGIMDRML